MKIIYIMKVGELCLILSESYILRGDIESHARHYVTVSVTSNSFCYEMLYVFHFICALSLTQCI